MTLSLLIFGFLFPKYSQVDAMAHSIYGQEKAQTQSTLQNGASLKPITKTNCLQQGKQLFWQKEYEAAIEQLEQCQLQQPENPEIDYFIAQCYFQQGMQANQDRKLAKAYQYFRKAYNVSDGAIEKYQQQIELNPEQDPTNAYLRLAYVYEIRSLIPGVDEYTEALEIYEKIIHLNPHMTYVYYHIGWIYYQEEEYQEAIAAFLEYVQANQESDFVYYYLGLSYDKIGDRQNAETYFQKIIDQFPASSLAEKAKEELE